MTSREGCLGKVQDADIKIVIDRIEKELDEYFKAIYPGYSKLISSERDPYLKHIDSLSHFYFYLNYLLDKYKDFFNAKPADAFILFYSKIASDAISIRQCLLLGQLISAISIERNIFETYVDTRLIIEKDTKERLVLYSDYEFIQIWLKQLEYQNYIDELEKKVDIDEEEKETLESLKRHLDGLISNEEMPRILENYNRVKDNYHPKYPFHWAWKIFKDDRNGRNPSISSICKSLGIYNDYLQVYVTNSFAVHNSPLMKNFLDRGKGISSIPNFSQSIIPITAISMNFAIETIKLILSCIKFPDLIEIEFYLNYLYKKTFID